MNTLSAPANELELEDRLSTPTPALIEMMNRLDGDLIVLGVAGKMGPSLARMAKRAKPSRRVVGVARFSTGGEAELRAEGIETVRCDLLDGEAVGRLPDAPNVVYMAGMKFGATGNESRTWAMNAYLPAIVCQRYRRSRIVAFSTGNVYGLCPIDRGGSCEGDRPDPVGEYAMSCLGRERMFEHFSREWNIPVAIVRVNYACDLRYGVLVDLAQKVLADQPIDLSMGYFNTIWQGDANAMCLRAFELAAVPARPINVTGSELLSVRTVATQFGERFRRPVTLSGNEGPAALLANAAACREALGEPRVPADRLAGWVADWVGRGGRTLGKPTKFESRDGRF